MRSHGLSVLSPRYCSRLQRGNAGRVLGTATAGRPGISGARRTDRAGSRLGADRPRTAHADADQTAHAGVVA